MLRRQGEERQSGGYPRTHRSGGEGGRMGDAPGPLLFVLLWRMVACTRALPDQVWWRLLRSSVNHAPDMERRHLSSTPVSWRALHPVKTTNRSKPPGDALPGPGDAQRPVKGARRPLTLRVLRRADAGPGLASGPAGFWSAPPPSGGSGQGESPAAPPPSLTDAQDQVSAPLL